MSKKWLSTIIALVCCTGAAGAQSQMEMNFEAGKDYQKTDKELNVAYQQVLKKYKDNKQFIADLRKAETAWVSYRDKQMDAIYPSTDTDDYGSVYSMCRSQELNALTYRRVLNLKELLTNKQDSRSEKAPSTAATEAELTKTYAQALKMPHPDEPLFAKKLALSQQAWLLFRNADADAWSAITPPGKDAAVFHNTHLLKLDKERIQDLNEWVHGVEEGDVCAGSRRVQ